MEDKQRTELAWKKDDILELDITNIGNDGEGIGKVNGYTLFVKDALAGDRVLVKIMKLKKHFGYAKLLEILHASPDRVTPVCSVSKKCGGCQLQHCSYQRQLRYKEEKVKDCLERIGGFHIKMQEEGDSLTAAQPESPGNAVQMEPILAMEEPYFYRNKAQFPIGVSKSGELITGFYAGRTHQIVPNTSCVIQHPCHQVILENILEFMREYHISAYDESSHQGLVRHILIRVGAATNEIMVCLVINGKKLPFAEKLVETLRAISFRDDLHMKSICLNINCEKSNVILGKEISVLYGQGYIEDDIGDIRFRLSPLSFYQVNPAQTVRLYETALEYADLKGGEVVWDLYCGIGTISLFLAKKAKKVCGVEIVPQAVEDARENARRNQIDNVEFFAGAAEEVVPQIYQRSGGGLKADVVTLDPPRKGCDPVLLHTVLKMQPERIVYVSCDPATLARDLRILCEGGYELKRVRACDMFGMSAHVETVVLLSHKKPDSHINIKVDFGEEQEKVPIAEIEDKADSHTNKRKGTYKNIVSYIEAKYGFKVHTAYIAEVKRGLGLPMYDAPNGVEKLKHPRRHPTPEKVEAIMDALKYFKIIS